jgi:hypothetical protein
MRPWNGEGVRYAIRLPANDVLERRIEDLLTRPRGVVSRLVWKSGSTLPDSAPSAI